MTHDVDAIYDQGVFRPIEPLFLPEGSRVHLHIEDTKQEGIALASTAHIYSPRLVHPEQVTDFKMEIGEVPDAGV